MSYEFGIPFRKVLQMSHRDVNMHIAWLNEQYHIPSRSDYYLMQIAQEVRRVLAKRKKSIKLKHFLLKFVGSKSREKRRFKERVAQSKAYWRGVTRIAKYEKKHERTRTPTDGRPAPG